MEQAREAVEYYTERNNCAQSILAAYGPAYGLKLEDAFKLGAAFGGGIGRIGHLCGAVSGSLMVIGLASSSGMVADAAGKALSAERAREFIRLFKQRYPSIMCSELLGIDLAAPGGYVQAQNSGKFTELCPLIVAAAAETLAQVLAQPSTHG